MKAVKRIVVGLGEVLWDLLPTGKQLGGAPANFAYHAHALGAEAWPVSCVGHDPLGREILDRLRAVGLPIDGVAIAPSTPTGTVTVELAADGQPQFTIHENVAWDRLVATSQALEMASRADAVCFGSLAQRSTLSRDTIRSLLRAVRSDALRVFDINLRQHYYSRELIESSLALSNALKINDQELPVVAEMFNLPGQPAEQLAQLAKRHRLRLVALTRGSQGSLLYVDGQFANHPGLPAKVVDTVGAGDAFTAMMALGFLNGLPLDEISRRANELAAYVCSQPGAMPPLPPELRAHLLS